MTVAELTVEPLAEPPAATVTVPGSRSITNRALVCAALAVGRSHLVGVGASEDTEAMAGCLRELGATVDVAGSDWTVTGFGGRPAPGPAALHARLSGTTSRFVLPLLALGRGEYRLDADGPMRRRPMADLVGALGELGVQIETTEGHLPIRVLADGLHGGAVSVSGEVSSQFLSGLLLVGPATVAGLAVEVVAPLKSRPYVEMTRAVMAEFGAEVERQGETWVVAAGAYRAADYAIEPDASTAAYFLAAAAVTGGRVRVRGLTRRSLQGDVAFADVLDAMGCTVEWGTGGVEVVGGPLRGVEVDLADCSDLAPTVAVVAAFATGSTRVGGIGFIRAKESDRIAGVVDGLGALGVEAEEEPDGFVVHPGGGAPHGGRIETHDDHRMAMAFGVAGLVVPGVRIVDPACVAKTFPGFWEALDDLRRTDSTRTGS